LRHVSYIQPSHQVESVHFNRAHADLQYLRNLTVRVPDRHQAKDVTLPRREEISVDLFL
jgi:hypothetical protein